MDLGRFQAGQSVFVYVTTVNGDGDPAIPDAAPVATITGGDGVIWSGKIAMDGSYHAFSASVFLGTEYPLGIYSVEYTWEIDGSAGSSSDSFEVIRGGDVGGRVISMFGFERPEGNYVVTHVDSGNVIQGRNPRL